MSCNRMYRIFKTLIFLVLAGLITTSCAYFKSAGPPELPPILAPDEIIRPYITMGRIQITIDRYGPQIENVSQWGANALREEASKMGADAVMLPEINSRPTSYLIVPSAEYTARGVAIKFK